MIFAAIQGKSFFLFTIACGKEAAAPDSLFDQEKFENGIARATLDGAYRRDVEVEC